MTESASMLLEAEGLSVAARGVALQDLSFGLPAGSVTALVAEPKAAGLLLLDCLAGALRPDSGVVRVAGADAHKDPAVAARVSIVRGPGRFPFAVRVGELLDQVSLLMGEKGGRRRVVEELELKEIESARPMDLPGEQQIMVRVACSLLGPPDVLLYDRLLQNLSPARAAVVLRMLGRLREQGKAVLIAGDDLEHIEASCDRVLVVAGGRVKACDSAAAVLRSGPDRMRVEVFTSAAVDLDAARRLACVREARREADRCEFLVDNQFQSVHQLLDFFRSAGVELSDVRTYRPSLTDAILRLLRAE